MTKVCTGANTPSIISTATNSRLPPKMATAIKMGYQKAKPAAVVYRP